MRALQIRLLICFTTISILKMAAQKLLTLLTLIDGIKERGVPITSVGIPNAGVV
jgi:hypothetical protein